MASGKGADSTKSTTFGLLWSSLHFGGPRSRKCRKSTGALEMASGKGADSTKSTTFGLLCGSLHFGPKSRKCRKSTGALEMTSGNFGCPRSRKCRKSTGALEMASGKGADSTKSTTFGLFWCSAVPEAGNAGNPHGPMEMASGKGADRHLLGFCGVPSISAVPEAGNPGNPQGLGKWLPEKERALRKRHFFLWSSIHFGGTRLGILISSMSKLLIKFANTIT